MLSAKPEKATGELDATIARIVHGFQTWSRLDLRNRIDSIRRLRKAISGKARLIASAIAEECGRPLVETLAQEVFPVLEMAVYCEKMFPRWLSRRNLPYRRPGFLRTRNRLSYLPLGPVAVLAPWNFPFSLGMMTLIYAALPGNTVLLKPSEKSRLIPPLIEELLRDSGLDAAGAAALIPGGPDTGQWLIEHPEIKKIFFFGRPAAGERVARACVEHHKPYVLEAGGGSLALVCADADIEYAAAGLAWSSFYARGHSCVSTERILVDRAVAGPFLAAFRKKASDFRKNLADGDNMQLRGRAEAAGLNPCLADAEIKGAEVFRAGGFPSDGNDGASPFTVLSNVTNAMRVAAEHLFGPAVAVITVADLEAAITELDEDLQSMGISIWSKNRKRALHLAEKTSAGMVWINDASYGLPHLPWGGTGKNDRGTLFSEFSLHEVTRRQWISRRPARPARPRLWWNPYTRGKEKIMIWIAEHFF